MNLKLSKHVSIVGLTFIITSLTSFSSKPEMSAVLGIIGSLMLLVK